ncbi:HTH-type transcriptional regulator CymR [Aquisphaera giovannonii]|uniref:HTH-type transcriptional regulator CymR n=1 Tax=Aquisphaera giovannonii TaxID=406548 RepID=A0A5B9VY70_9BACT|nr:Rrf2 family transcriptional regulator [Aquisphaera giovannonii]QEH33326.1 HTH-type transcriptional regulator CymR [Aquisphaera giovannonii]
MTVSAKCYYALRALYALAEHADSTPLKASEIAERQHIPIKFLEAILSQLKGGGYVNSRRGVEGGYFLAKPADRLKIGEVIRFIDGPIAPVDCVSVSRPKECEYPGQCPFFGFWGRVRQSISDVVDQTTFTDLMKENEGMRRVYIPDWTI